MENLIFINYCIVSMMEIIILCFSSYSINNELCNGRPFFTGIKVAQNLIIWTLDPSRRFYPQSSQILAHNSSKLQNCSQRSEFRFRNSIIPKFQSQIPGFHSGFWIEFGISCFCSKEYIKYITPHNIDHYCW